MSALIYQEVTSNFSKSVKNRWGFDFLSIDKWCTKFGHAMPFIKP